MVVIPAQKLYIALTMFENPHISVAKAANLSMVEQFVCVRDAILLPFSLLRPYLQRLFLLR